jgi:hypothetical protein
MWLRGIGRVFLSRRTIALINLLIAAVVGFALIDFVRAFSLTDLADAEETLTGMGVILIAYGVALEERHTLREIFGLDIHVDEDREERIDRICHHYGLGQLILGLFSEVAVECVRIPDRVINTSGIELHVLLASGILLAIGFVLSLIQIIRLFSSGR